MKTFDIATETETLDDYDFSGNQQQKALANDCVRAFRFRYLAGDVNKLPKYILIAIHEAGYTPIHLGGTTYKYSVVGLKKTTADDERRALNSLYWCPSTMRRISELATDAIAKFPELKTEFVPRLVALSLEASK